MRPAIIVVMSLLLLIVAAGGYYTYQYVDQAKNLPKEILDSDEWKTAVNQVRFYRYGELAGCWLLLPLISFGLAWLKVPTRISWLRNVVAILVTFAVVFIVTMALMHGALAERNASYVLPPSAIWDAIWYALSALLAMAVILFVIERIYVRRLVAPHG